jgi:hypothetical protein
LLAVAAVVEMTAAAEAEAVCVLLFLEELKYKLKAELLLQ